MVQQIEAANSYSTDIGADLGILNPPPPAKVVVGNLLPFIKKFNTFPHGKVELNCSLQGMKGANIYSRRGAKTDFTLLKTTVDATTADDRPNAVANQPEVREYEFIFVQKGAEVGQRSQPVQVTTQI